ncbi:hypothetical protein EIP91_003396 [Steccherinum ochraceum]|uniref:Protein kinase domain-containing protein n=1 Tax=Steccherinum ochraceum TaxID=92696 RepID=A0A4R0RE42_9APHY|nr:hypothetical protein EIP91_003396 [Steccherinum ochraceum]
MTSTHSDPYHIFIQHDSLVPQRSTGGEEPHHCAFEANDTGCMTFVLGNQTFDKVATGRQSGALDHGKLALFRGELASFRFLKQLFASFAGSDPIEQKYLFPVKNVLSQIPLWQLSEIDGPGFGCKVDYDIRSSLGGKDITIWKGSDSGASEASDPLVRLLCVAPGTICWRDFDHPTHDEAGDDNSWFRCTMSAGTLQWIWDAFDHRTPGYAVITDEHEAVIVDSVDLLDSTLYVSCVRHTLNSQFSLRCIVGASIHYSLVSQCNYKLAEIATPDIKELLNAGFSTWTGLNAGSEEPLLAHSYDLQVNASLAVHVDAFSKDTPFQFEFHARLEKPPQQTLDILRAGKEEWQRPRDNGAEGILNAARRRLVPGTELPGIPVVHFIVSERVWPPEQRSDRLEVNIPLDDEEKADGSTHPFSRVFMGCLELRPTSDPMSWKRSKKLCLKLFDESLLPASFSSPDRPLEPSMRMMCHEHAVYKRLEYLQGSLIPHEYGFHKFQRPGYMPVYGFLMEAIEGTPLNISSPKWSDVSQYPLIRGLRHALRTFLYGGVKQLDWHPGQIIICPQDRATTTEPDDTDFSFVLVDFAFVELRLGKADGSGVRFRQSPENLEWMLHATSSIRREIMDSVWFPEDDYEA